ncbi:MAG TPA: DUF302 domain-containing protein [Stellaceae bacterium]|nr:DUF302 domain-containing protein [Stellaceae bacterium]
MASNGLITRESTRPAKATIDRLAAALAAKGVTIFARIDHAQGAAEVGMSLPPTEVLIFGNPKAGTPLMQENPAIGIDLPLKMVAWQDATGKSWVAYNDPAWLAQRHGVKGLAAGVAAMAALLEELARHAAT